MWFLVSILSVSLGDHSLFRAHISNISTHIYMSDWGFGLMRMAFGLASPLVSNRTKKREKEAKKVWRKGL
ncbi:MAG: hypothetical protein DA446_01555 [Bacteroidetes bacterium]|nr:MAG: hypothetical protein DA446_01555 [Bacteroidota bacterium]